MDDTQITEQDALWLIALKLHEGQELAIEEQLIRFAAFRRLREEFAAEQVGKLPRPLKKGSEAGRCKPEAEGGKAPIWQDYFCGKWHGLPAVHLDYAGHAAVTSRLLEVDPWWNWEPFQREPVPEGRTGLGYPVFVRDASGYPIGLWGNVTVLGMTRPGYGSVQQGKDDPEKELIGDMLRNAMMRQGVALDLWVKGHDEEQDADDKPAASRYQREQSTASSADDTERPPLPEGWSTWAAYDAWYTLVRERMAKLTPAKVAMLREWYQSMGYKMPVTASQATAWTNKLAIIEILADDVDTSPFTSAEDNESTDSVERAASAESTDDPERAGQPESTMTGERAEMQESTDSSERADWAESTVRVERAVTSESTELRERLDDGRLLDPKTGEISE